MTISAFVKQCVNVVHSWNACWLTIRTLNMATQGCCLQMHGAMMFIMGISLLSLELQSIVGRVHTCAYVQTIWTVPWGWGCEEGNVQSGLIRMLHVWWEERSSSFPNADPTSHAGSAARQGPLPPNPPPPPFLLGDSPGLLSVTMSSTPHPRGLRGVGTRCFKSHHSVRERVIFTLNQRHFPFCQFAIVYLCLLRYVPHLPLSFGSIVLIGVLCQSCIDCDH